MTAALISLVRPDGRCLVRSRGGWTAPTAVAAAELAERRGRPALVHVDVAATDEQAVLHEAGFVEARRDVRAELSVPAALAALADARLPAGVVLRSAADVDENRLRLLDDELRQDVPSTDGWRSTAAEFREHTFGDSAFDLRTYLVAVDCEPDAYLGLVRVWINPDGPRLGMVGVRRPYRRRGLASALLGHVLTVVDSLGARLVIFEADLANGPSQAFFARLDPRPTGITVELVYEPRSEGEEARVA